MSIIKRINELPSIDLRETTTQSIESMICGAQSLNRMLSSCFEISWKKERKRLSSKLQNPRILRISFHTFRHWKATTLYHETKDPLYVKEFLGHKKLDTTLLYIQLEKTLYKEQTDTFTVKLAKNKDEITDLLATGFDYICEKDGLAFFRKRK